MDSQDIDTVALATAIGLLDAARIEPEIGDRRNQRDQV